jgi:hypothetical protein
VTPKSIERLLDDVKRILRCRHERWYTEELWRDELIVQCSECGYSTTRTNSSECSATHAIAKGNDDGGGERQAQEIDAVLSEIESRACG